MSLTRFKFINGWKPAPGKGFQSMINMGVNMGVLPTKGLTLPLMSFGGTGILANCIAIAILLRIDWENRQMMKGQPV